jgi:hypothetical protein
VLAYIAGLLDGEGCFVSNYSSCPARYPSIRVEITQTRRDLLEWIQSLLGGKIRQKHAGSGISRYPCWLWCPEDTRAFMKLMKPYVRLKRPQLEVTLAFYSLPYGSTAKKQSLAEKLTELNKWHYEMKI